MLSYDVAYVCHAVGDATAFDAIRVVGYSFREEQCQTATIRPARISTMSPGLIVQAMVDLAIII
jgi:hypothetical protein